MRTALSAVRSPQNRVRAGLLLLAALMMSGSATAAEESSAKPAPAAASGGDDPCDDYLSSIDRPTMATGPCVLKPWHIGLEQGLVTGTLKGSDFSHVTQFPQSEARLGLPEGWELKVFPPNYNIATEHGSAGGRQVFGFGDVAVGAKHQFAPVGDFVFGIDTRLTVPSGRTEFSDGGVEGLVQGTVSYSITPKLGISGLIGVASLTTRDDNGHLTRFTSFNPDVVLSYKLTDQLQVYSEIYANTLVAPHEGGNVSYQGGVQYMITKSLEVDVSAGTLLHGQSNLSDHYLTFGAGYLF